MIASPFYWKPHGDHRLADTGTPARAIDRPWPGSAIGCRITGHLSTRRHPRKSAVDLARDLLQAHDGRLARLVGASLSQLACVPGIGQAKAAQLKASFELARRALVEEMTQRDNFASPGKVREWLKLKLAAQAHEVFMALAGRAEPLENCGGIIPGHTDPDLGLSARGRQGRVKPQRRLPSFSRIITLRPERTVQCRRGADTKPEGCPGAGRRPYSTISSLPAVARHFRLPSAD